MLTKLSALKDAESRVYRDSNVIRDIAISLAENRFNRSIPVLRSLTDHIDKELKFILSLIKDIASLDEIAVHVLRSRIEYFCCSVNAIALKVDILV